jgi:hypothetical protein
VKRLTLTFLCVLFTRNDRTSSMGKKYFDFQKPFIPG